MYQAFVDESFFLFPSISFQYSFIALFVDAFVSADVELFLTEYTFGVHTCIFRSFMVLATLEYVLHIRIPICLYVSTIYLDL